jgi:ribulose-bisphosphate carboxylase large chain
LLATVCGNLYELAEHTGCKLLDLELPEAFAERYPGPQFGIEGTRELAGSARAADHRDDREAECGLSPDQTAALVRVLGEAGIDFIKDDELMADPPHSPFAERVKAVMRVIDELADRTGKRVMLRSTSATRWTDVAASRSGGGGGRHLCDGESACGGVGGGARVAASEPVAHPWASERVGDVHAASAARGRVWRVAEDLAPGGGGSSACERIENKFWEPDDSVVRSIEACLAPLYAPPGPAYPVLPVVSSGQWGGQAPETYRRTRTLDLMYVAGGGIMAHPGGPASGVRALRQAWEAAVAGVPLEEYTREHEALRETLAKFGGLSSGGGANFVSGKLLIRFTGMISPGRRMSWNRWRGRGCGRCCFCGRRARGRLRRYPGIASVGRGGDESDDDSRRRWIGRCRRYSGR